MPAQECREVSMGNARPAAARSARVHALVLCFLLCIPAVLAANPVIRSTPPARGAPNVLYQYQVNATDADNDTLTYQLDGPFGASISSTGLLTWTPIADQRGTHNFTITVSDGTEQAVQRFSVSIQFNSPPQISNIPGKEINELDTLTFTISATDQDNDALAFYASDLPEGSTFSNKKFTWIPTQEQAGTYTTTFFVTDGIFTDSDSVTITVNDVTGQLLLDIIPDKVVKAGEPLTFSVSAAQFYQQETLLFTASRLPQGAVFNGTTKTFFWTPTAAQKGIYQLKFSVTDRETVVSQYMTITVKVPQDITIFHTIPSSNFSQLSFIIADSLNSTFTPVLHFRRNNTDWAMNLTREEKTYTALLANNGSIDYYIDFSDEFGTHYYGAKGIADSLQETGSISIRPPLTNTTQNTTTSNNLTSNSTQNTTPPQALPNLRTHALAAERKNTAVLVTFTPNTTVDEVTFFYSYGDAFNEVPAEKEGNTYYASLPLQDETLHYYARISRNDSIFYYGNDLTQQPVPLTLDLPQKEFGIAWTLLIILAVGILLILATMGVQHNVHHEEDLHQLIQSHLDAGVPFSTIERLANDQGWQQPDIHHVLQTINVRKKKLAEQHKQLHEQIKDFVHDDF
ncbi:MAG: putative Ig domain-containing protein [archaeon]